MPLYRLGKRLLVATAAVTLLASATCLAIAGWLVPFSSSGWAEILALALIGVALALRRARRILLVATALLLATTLIVRFVETGTGKTRVRTLPGGTSSRWLARVVDEQDVSLLGARLLTRLWHLKGSDRDDLLASMHEAYVELRRDEGATASPVLDTLLLRQSADAFDTIVIEPQAPPRAAVVFLHGFAGSYTLECWLVAQAARAIDAVTVCPATGFSGHWTEYGGERTVRATIDYLHSRGIHRLFLAGLSNGGFGAIALAPRFARELAGLIVISGASSTGGSAGLPTLVIQGEQDANVPAAYAHAYAARVHAKYAGFDAGHFVLLTRREAVREAIVQWLRQYE